MTSLFRILGKPAAERAAPQALFPNMGSSPLCHPAPDPSTVKPARPFRSGGPAAGADLQCPAARRLSVRMHPQTICAPSIPGDSNAPSFHPLPGQTNSTLSSLLRLRTTLPEHWSWAQPRYAARFPQRRARGEGLPVRAENPSPDATPRRIRLSQPAEPHASALHPSPAPPRLARRMPAEIQRW